MAEDMGTLERIAEGLANALTGLSEIAQPANLAVLLNELGIDNPPNLSGDAQLAQSLSDAVTHATELTPRVEELILAAEEGGTREIATAGAAVLVQCTAVGVALEAVGARLQAALATAPGGPQLAAEFAKRVIGDVIARYLDAEHPLLRRVLTLATVLEWDVVTPETDGSVGIIRRRLRLERLPKLLSDPLELLESGYGWGRNDFNASRLLQRISELFEPLNPIAAFGDEDGPPAPPVLDFGAFALSPAATTSPGLAGELFLEVAENAVLTLAQLSDEWSAVLGLDGSFREGLTVRLVPPTELEITPPPGGILEGRVVFEVVGQAADPLQPVLLLGIAGGSRIEAKLVSAGVEATGSWSLGAPRADADVGIRAVITGGRILVSPAGGDGFLTAVLPSNGMQLDFDIKVGWSSTRGLHIDGGTGLAITIPVNRLLGPILLDSVNVGGSVESSALALTAGVTARVGLGPVKAVIEDIGLRLDVDFASGGNLGLANLDLHFKPPNGLGLVIDAQVVLGGGYLRFDPQKAEYSGMLELQIAEKISVKAIGLLTTRMPDGAKGYSLVVIVFTERFAPIQLGFGFTLTGIGGLLAVNRTFDEEALRAGLKNHTLDSVMFPKDPIRNAPQIISNLNKVFPPANGHHLFGPMAQIAWGTPPLITADLGIVLELGARLRLLVLAQVEAILPRRENDLVRLKMDAIGVLDFDQGTASLDATLYDSRLLKKFTLTGDMAMRLKWEDSPNFALAVGGLHPAFNPPPAFPKLERIAINLSAGDNPRLRCEAYFALTSNTVQFGARAELYASALGFSIQGEIGFDVLIQLAPFFFLAEFHAQVQLKRGSTNLFKVRVEGALSGPRPLHIKGKATFEVLWWDVSIRIDKTLVEGEKPPPPEPIDVMPRLKEALNNPGAWIGQLPAGQRQMVTLRAKPEAAPEVLLHPLGTLTVKQSAVPLNLVISRFGHAAPAGARRFTISSVSLGGLSQTTQPVKDFFAPAQFFEMSDDEKLSRPSFEPMTAGVSIGSSEFAFTADANDWLEVEAIEFETWIVDKQKNETRRSNPEDSKKFYKLSPELLGRQSRFGAAGVSDLRRTGKAKYRTTVGKHRIAKEGWSIVAPDDLTAQPAPGIEEGKPASYSEAAQALRQLKQESSAKAAGFKILRLSELSDG
jgi:hypothetical protein